MSLPHITIAYGPNHRTELEEFIGEKFRQSAPYPAGMFGRPTTHMLPRSIGGSVYEKPYWTAYQLTDGRVAVVMHYTGYDKVWLHPDFKTYSVWLEARTSLEAYDIETGRKG